MSARVHYCPLDSSTFQYLKITGAIIKGTGNQATTLFQPMDERTPLVAGAVLACDQELPANDGEHGGDEQPIPEPAEGSSPCPVRLSQGLPAGLPEGDSAGVQPDTGSGEPPRDVSPAPTSPYSRSPSGSKLVLGSPARSGSSSGDSAGRVSRTPSAELLRLPARGVLSPVIKPGFAECVLEVKAFARGGRPGLERLKRVLPTLFAAFGIREIHERRNVLLAVDLVPLYLSGDVTFIIPKEEMSPPAWKKNSRPRLDDLDSALIAPDLESSQTALVSPA